LKPLSQVMTIETPTGVLAAEETVPLAGGGYGGHSAAASAMSHTAAATHARSSRHRRRRRAIANVFNGPRFSTVNIQLKKTQNHLQYQILSDTAVSPHRPRYRQYKR